MMAQSTDYIGLSDEVLRRLNQENGPREIFENKLVEETAKKLGLNVDEQIGTKKKLELLQEYLHGSKLLISNPGPVILKTFQAIQTENHIPAWIDKFKDKNEIEDDRFTPSIETGMKDFLLRRGVRLREEGVSDKAYEKYGDQLADAFHYAYQREIGGYDPVDSALTGGAVDTWDFTVDTFEDVGQQEVLSTNILAAGALLYIYYLGERMGIFNLVDVLVLNWATGLIDVVEGEGVKKLYRYWKLREQRMTTQERMMVYRRVLNLGNGEVLSRMTINEHFPNLWRNVMTEVAEYIDKKERSKSDPYYSPVSITGIELAAKDLAYNLTEYTTGMVHMQIREMYAQLQRAIEILRDEQVLSHFGGTRRKTLSKVIETLSKQEYQKSPNIAAVRTLAVEGYKILQAIADNSQALEAAISTIVDSGEAWVIAASAEEESDFMEGDTREETDQDDFDSFEDEDDDFGEDNFGDEEMI